MEQVQRGDLTGLRFGHLLVLSRDGFKVSSGGSKRTMWKCRCDCGAEVSVLGTNLKNGNTKSCGKCGLVAKRCRVSDLTGRRFGYLTAIERADDHITKGGHRLISWKCQCDCGREICVLATNLRNGNSKSCGQCGLTRGQGVLEDLTEQRFGYLTVVRRAENHVSTGGNSFAAWECQCDCGNMVVVTAGHLKTGHTRSCGKCGKFDHSSDFVGKRFGRLTVLAKSDECHVYPSGDRDFKWICRCDCGNIVVTRGNTLRNKKFNHSCGCWRKEESVRDEDMLGKRFGNCVVIARAERIRVSETSTIDAWYCRCDCGNEFIARGPQLRFGKLVSCGCKSMSRWESWLAQFLDENCVSYEPQKFYDELVGLGGGLLLYDFCLSMNGQDVLIECQGVQHYRPVDVFGGLEAFEKQVEHDRRKREYAESHGIPLIVLDCSDSHMNREQYVNLIQNHIGKYIR